MPEFKCQNCGAIWYGWGVSMICRYCDSKLVPVNETAKRREINKYVGLSTREDGTF
jgi:hypothetical protein